MRLDLSLSQAYLAQKASVDSGRFANKLARRLHLSDGALEAFSRKENPNGSQEDKENVEASKETDQAQQNNESTGNTINEKVASCLRPTTGLEPVVACFPQLVPEGEPKWQPGKRRKRRSAQRNRSSSPK